MPGYETLDAIADSYNPSLALIAAGLPRAQWRLAGMRALAVAIVASVAYGLMFLDRRLIVLWIGSFAGYVLLMLYQRYHGISDIATTGAVVGVPVALAIAYLYRRTNEKGRRSALSRELPADA
jgi:hypothetical protein